MTNTPTEAKAPCPLAVMDELLKRFDATIPTPMNARGESTMRIEHFVDLAHEAKQARAKVAELVAADREVDRLREIAGGWSLNAVEWHNLWVPATARRAAALAAFSEDAR